jgi:hypothetical protein
MEPILDLLADPVLVQKNRLVETIHDEKTWKNPSKTYYATFLDTSMPKHRKLFNPWDKVESVKLTRDILDLLPRYDPQPNIDPDQRVLAQQWGVELRPDDIEPTLIGKHVVHNQPSQITQPVPPPETQPLVQNFYQQQQQPRRPETPFGSPKVTTYVDTSQTLPSREKTTATATPTKKITLQLPPTIGKL